MESKGLYLVGKGMAKRTGRETAGSRDEVKVYLVYGMNCSSGG